MSAACVDTECISCGCWDVKAVVKKLRAAMSPAGLAAYDKQNELNLWRILVRQLGQPDEYRPLGSSRGGSRTDSNLIYGQEKPHSRRLLREFTLNHARLRRLDDLLLDSRHRLSATGHRQQKAKKIPSLDPLTLSTKIPIPSLTMYLPAGSLP
uniref:Uncharacterized protein n=1 Tax=Pristionchus pacificus TaxID=54126 RepID=A0A8R1UQ63_PRIPA